MRIVLFIFVLVVSCIPAKAQGSKSHKSKSDIQTVSYCEILRHPNLYVGKEIRFRALYTSVFEMSAFSSALCKGDSYMVWVEFEDASIQSSTRAQTYQRFEKMMTRYADERWVIFNTEMLVTAVLDNSQTGYGHMGMYRFLATVKSIEKLGKTKKIDLEKKRRVATGALSNKALQLTAR